MAVFLIGFGISGLQAQEVITTAGGDASGSGGTVAYSIGQLVYTTCTGTNGSVAQGVQQPYEISVTTGLEVNNIDLVLSAYPNPTSDLLNLKLKEYDNKNLAYQLYDMQGNLLVSKKIKGNISTVNMANLPASTYFLQVMDNQKPLKIFKIIKN